MSTRMEGLPDLIKGLDRLKTRASRPLAELEREITRWLLNRQRERFDSAGTSAGVTWPKASSPYLRLKAALLGGDVRPLRWGGRPEERLYPSLTEEGHPDQILRVDPSGTIEIGTRVPYAEQLEAGGVDPFGVPFGGHDLTSLSDEQQARLLGAIDRFVTGGELSEEWQR